MGWRLNQHTRISYIVYSLEYTKIKSIAEVRSNSLELVPLITIVYGNIQEFDAYKIMQTDNTVPADKNNNESRR